MKKRLLGYSYFANLSIVFSLLSHNTFSTASITRLSASRLLPICYVNSNAYFTMDSSHTYVVIGFQQFYNEQNKLSDHTKIMNSFLWNALYLP